MPSEFEHGQNRTGLGPESEPLVDQVADNEHHGPIGQPELEVKAQQDDSLVGADLEQQLRASDLRQDGTSVLGPTSLPIQPNGEAATLPSFKRKGRYQGWHFGMTFVTALTLTIFIVNTILAIVAATDTRFLNEEGIVTIFKGSCKTVDWWSRVLHIVINILSSALLAASNYTMQCLAAPTRDEIHTAHAKGDWLDIGVPSLRNVIGRISARRTVLWWLLCLSSLPIHLVFNSVAFKTTAMNIYCKQCFVTVLRSLTNRPFW